MNQPAKRRIFGLRRGCCFTVFVAVLMTGGTAWYFWANRTTVGGVESMVSKEGPPVGSTRPEVEAWLESRKIDQTRGTGLWDTGGYPAGLPPAKICELTGREVGECVVGKIRGVDVGGLFAGDIWIYFFFDKDDRLVKYCVHGWEQYL